LTLRLANVMAHSNKSVMTSVARLMLWRSDAVSTAICDVKRKELKSS